MPITISTRGTSARPRLRFTAVINIYNHEQPAPTRLRVTSYETRVAPLSRSTFASVVRSSDAASNGEKFLATSDTRVARLFFPTSSFAKTAQSRFTASKIVVCDACRECLRCIEHANSGCFAHAFRKSVPTYHKSRMPPLNDSMRDRDRPQ